MRNKTVKKIFTIIACIAMLVSIVPSIVFADTATEIKVTIRVEGISSSFYDQTIKIPYSGTLTVKDALTFADTNSESLSVSFEESTYGAYIAGVNGETAGLFGGYDGWLYLVNNTDPGVGITQSNLVEGDTLVVYYGDPFGKGMQNPILDSSKSSQGILKFTSKDTTYDENWNPIVTENPVKGATVTWYNGETSVTFTTNDNGEVTIPTDKLNAGTHKVNIEKYDTEVVSGKYLPLVLRLPSETTVEIAATSSEDVTSSTNESSNSTSDDSAISQTGTGSENAPTGDSSLLLFAILLLISGSGLVIAYKRKEKGTI